jgi:hypothetical protein
MNSDWASWIALGSAAVSVASLVWNLRRDRHRLRVRLDPDSDGKYLRRIDLVAVNGGYRAVTVVGFGYKARSEQEPHEGREIEVALSDSTPWKETYDVADLPPGKEIEYFYVRDSFGKTIKNKQRELDRLVSDYEWISDHRIPLTILTW